MTYEEYKETKSFIEQIALRLMNHEGKDAAKVGFPINNYFEYRIDGRRFFCVQSNVFVALMKSHIELAQQNEPHKFGTGDANDVIEAIYNVEPTGNIKWFKQFLASEQFAYIFEYTSKPNFDKILRIDLYRDIQLNENEQAEFIGGIFHAYKHFSLNGINLSTGKDINDIDSPEELLIKATKAFFVNDGNFKKEKEYVVVQNLDYNYDLKYSFFFEPKTEQVYFINTIFKTKKK